MEKLTMNRKEREQAKIFELLRLKSITTAEAAARLKITPKWVRKKYKRYLTNGDAGLVHKGRGKPSHLRLDQEKIDLIIKLANSDYEGFRPKFIARKLAQQYDIKICKETTRKILI